MHRLLHTKSELKRQKDHLRRWLRYLPTLQLRKRQLQAEVERLRRELRRVDRVLQDDLRALSAWAGLLAEDPALSERVALEGVEVEWESVAGVVAPAFRGARVRVADYDLFDTPLWMDRAIEALRALLTAVAEAAVLNERSLRLSRELRITAQRVNLFERIKVPEARAAIRRIAIHLGDQQTAAFGWALAAKRKRP